MNLGSQKRHIRQEVVAGSRPPVGHDLTPDRCYHPRLRTLAAVSFCSHGFGLALASLLSRASHRRLLFSFSNSCHYGPAPTFALKALSLTGDASFSPFLQRVAPLGSSLPALSSRYAATSSQQEDGCPPERPVGQHLPRSRPARRRPPPFSCPRSMRRSDGKRPPRNVLRSRLAFRSFPE